MDIKNNKVYDIDGKIIWQDKKYEFSAYNQYCCYFEDLPNPRETPSVYFIYEVYGDSQQELKDKMNAFIADTRDFCFKEFPTMNISTDIIFPRINEEPVGANQRRAGGLDDKGDVTVARAFIDKFMKEVYYKHALVVGMQEIVILQATDQTYIISREFKSSDIITIPDPK